MQDPKVVFIGKIPHLACRDGCMMHDLAIFSLKTAEDFFRLVSGAVRASSESITQVL